VLGILRTPVAFRRIGSRDEFRRHWRRSSERRPVESGKILLRCAGRGLLDLLGLPIAAWNRLLLIGVGGNQAGVDRKPVGADQALEKPAQRVALAKAPVSVLRECRVIRTLSFVLFGNSVESVPKLQTLRVNGPHETLGLLAFRSAFRCAGAARTRTRRGGGRVREGLGRKTRERVGALS
jgi:hypothetical protein